MQIGAIVLAAGQGRRMGCPKVTAQLDGRWFVEHVLDALQGITQVAIVVQPETVEALSKRVKQSQLVVNHQWECGMSSSVAAGVLALSGCSHYCIFPVDHPRVQAGTVRQLIAAAQSHPQAMRIVPTYNGQRGHPILVRTEALAELMKNRSLPLHDLLRPFTPLEIAVDDDGILENINTPEQIKSEKR